MQDIICSPIGFYFLLIVYSISLTCVRRLGLGESELLRNAALPKVTGVQNSNFSCGRVYVNVFQDCFGNGKLRAIKLAQCGENG